MAAEADIGQAPGKPPIWNDPRYRALFFQVVVLGGIIFFFVYITNNTLANLERQGIASGFGFLSRTAGFDISMHLIDWDEEMTYGRAFTVSVINTLLVSFLGIVFATLLGFVMGVARLSRNWLIAKLSAVYIETFRNIPLLLQIFFWYFGVLRNLPESVRESVNVFDLAFLNRRGLFVPSPQAEPAFWVVIVLFFGGIVASIFLARWAKQRQEATGQYFPVLSTSAGLILGVPILAFIVLGFPINWDVPELGRFNFSGGAELIPEFVALLLALSVYTASFIAEIVRAGILSVSHGQTEAAFALGLRPNWTLRLIIIPQALRVIIPPLTSQYLNLTKNSSLAAAIAYPDLILVFAGTVLMQTGQAVEVIAMAMAVYLTISLLISALMNWYNKKIALVER
ncbi:MAG: amino acid ABC transporter permease [Alphaproteobacteria bacterium]|nr:amino acid ABC transporter permease [Alphaproteobacteria bacterium]